MKKTARSIHKQTDKGQLKLGWRQELRGLGQGDNRYFGSLQFHFNRENEILM